MGKILQVSGLSVSYGNQPVFTNLSFDAYRGEKISLIGESGSGKTTLINAICGFIPSTKGEVIIKGTNVNKGNIDEIRRKYLTWLPQEVSGIFETASELFFYPFTFKANKHLYPTKKQINEIFENFGLKPRLLEKNINEISGGQKQRIALASIILLKRDIVLLDEPTSALDEKNIKNITDYIFSLQDTTVIASTHNSYWMRKTGKIINLDEYATR